jgi:hypothetical protein
MGDTVRVKLVAASLEKRQLDYELVMEPAEKSGTAARKKTKK